MSRAALRREMKARQMALSLPVTPEPRAQPCIHVAWGAEVDEAYAYTTRRLCVPCATAANARERLRRDAVRTVRA